MNDKTAISQARKLLKKQQGAVAKVRDKLDDDTNKLEALRDDSHEAWDHLHEAWGHSHEAWVHLHAAWGHLQDARNALSCFKAGLDV